MQQGMDKDMDRDTGTTPLYIAAQEGQLAGSYRCASVLYVMLMLLMLLMLPMLQMLQMLLMLLI